jgi:hypothetical protein
MNFPAILVERPHLRPGRAWTADSAVEIIGVLAGNRYGDNWSSTGYDSLAQIEAVYGMDRADWPEELRELTADAFPIRHHESVFGSEVLQNPTDADELNFALEYIALDMSGLDVLDNKEEAQALLKRGAHNLPYAELREEMMILGWGEEKEEG